MIGDLTRGGRPLGRERPARRGRAALALVATGLAALAAQAGPARAAASGERIQVTGEIIDTWCYLSGVMGGQDAVVGSAHHTCAMWCAAGGIPVGLLGDDGEVYMVLKWEGSDDVAGGDTILELQSDRVVADGVLHRRDGVSYIIVEKVVANEGIANLSHEDYGVVPPFAIPEPKE
ncbi:hypothetical protein P2H44_11000 [Albimonas sp. CAU 1670]|uniref:hypothetical protein n=1 Tax=Albimonas sp. CAU 1670 TaxID=3032599 RepID=UPI0023DB2D7F|nr:hypothetical protein [Albimonas sp. CAU 1670]MDF2233079.1 hypothetical protein [Albimonas sp. CAU 1670]